MRKTTITLFSSIIFASSVVAQSNWNEVVHDIVHEPCGTDAIEMEARKNPQVVKFNTQLEDFTREYIANHKAEKSSATKFIIPVVYHILHENGTENIHDSMVNWDIKIINKMFSKKDPQLNEVVYEFQSIIADMEIEVRLATIDPNGNPTTGIDRINSALTNNAGDASRLNQWPPSKYLNIWTVKTMGNGSAAYTIFPGNAAQDSTMDGILIKSMYVGQTRSIGHELGHYLNVSHPWGINTSPGDPAGCNYDDLIDDTPNTIGWSTCDISGASCGNSIDNVQNYMEYSGCTRMFTEGQKARIHACLNSTTANRNKLWSYDNLVATGVSKGVGINEHNNHSANNIMISPNPVTENTILNFNIENSCKVTIELYDIVGKKISVITEKHMSAGNQQLPIGSVVSTLNKGVYFIHIQANGENHSRKLTVN